MWVRKKSFLSVLQLYVSNLLNSPDTKLALSPLTELQLDYVLRTTRH